MAIFYNYNLYIMDETEYTQLLEDLNTQFKEGRTYDIIQHAYFWTLCCIDKLIEFKLTREIFLKFKVTIPDDLKQYAINIDNLYDDFIVFKNKANTENINIIHAAVAANTASKKQELKSFITSLLAIQNIDLNLKNINQLIYSSDLLKHLYGKHKMMCTIHLNNFANVERHIILFVLLIYFNMIPVSE